MRVMVEATMMAGVRVMVEAAVAAAESAMEVRVRVKAAMVAAEGGERVPSMCHILERSRQP